MCEERAPGQRGAAGGFAACLRGGGCGAAMVKQRAQHVGMYLRLSREDLRRGESVSIEHQREILRRHIDEQGWTLVDVYVDDGYTGGNFVGVR